MRSCLFISASVGVYGWGGSLHGYLMRLCCLNRPVRGGGGLGIHGYLMRLCCLNRPVREGGGGWGIHGYLMRLCCF